MTIPAQGEHYGERRRSALARLYLAHERLAIGAGTLVGLLLAWEAFGRSGLVDPLFLPAPSQIAQAGWGLSHDADFWNDLAVSGREFILGYAAAVAVAIPLGLAVGLSRRLQYMLGPFVDTLNAVPRVTLLPLIVIWFGIGIWSKVMVVFLGAVIPILINTQAGVKTSEARFIRVARSFSASKLKIFSSIILPGTVPFIFTGLKYGAGRAARRGRRRALCVDGGARPHDRRGRQYVPDRRRVFRRADLHGHRTRGGGVPRCVRAAVRTMAAGSALTDHDGATATMTDATA